MAMDVSRIYVLTYVAHDWYVLEDSQVGIEIAHEVEQWGVPAIVKRLKALHEVDRTVILPPKMTWMMAVLPHVAAKHDTQWQDELVALVKLVVQLGHLP